MGRIINVKDIINGKFISLYDLEYKNKLNKKRHWFLASRKSKEELEGIYFDNKKETIDAVVIAAYHKTYQKLVLIRQFRVPINNYIYELPAGLVDKEDPDFITAAKRELKEETGFDIIDINSKFNKEKMYLSPGMTDESVGLIYCICDGEINYENLEEDEDIEVILVDKEKAISIMNSDERIDIKAYLILQNFIMNSDKIFK